MIRKIFLYFNTVAHLKPSQILYRARRICPRSFFRHNDDDSPPPVKDGFPWVGFLSFREQGLAPDAVDDARHGRVRVLEKTLDWADGKVLADKSLSKLHLFHLNYFDIVSPLCYDYKVCRNSASFSVFCRVVDDYLSMGETPEGVHPYPTSLRIVNLLSAYSFWEKELRSDDRFRERYIRWIYAQYKYLSRNMEWDIRANHLFENIKACLLAAMFFQEENAHTKFRAMFMKQVNEQVTESGAHFELSFMYHSIVLAGVFQVMAAAEKLDPLLCGQLRPVAARMTQFLHSGQKGLGKLPYFNDSAHGQAPGYSALAEHAASIGLAPLDIELTGQGGYYTLESGSLKLIFDCGREGADCQPGHSHCDCLSFECSAGGKPLIVNSGTYCYEGSKRQFVRSVRAHNTAQIEGYEQSECWGVFRLARRMRSVGGGLSGPLALWGRYETYQGVTHRRSLDLAGGKLVVRDFLNGKSGLRKSYLRFFPGICVKVNSGGSFSLSREGCRVGRLQALPGVAAKLCEDGDMAGYSRALFKWEPAAAVEFSWPENVLEGGYFLEFYISEGEVV